MVFASFGGSLFAWSPGNAQVECCLPLTPVSVPAW